MKIRPVGDGFMGTDGQTDMTKPIVAFRYFANARKNNTQEESPTKIPFQLHRQERSEVAAKITSLHVAWY